MSSMRGSLRNEACKGTATANSFEKLNALRLCTESQFPARRTLQGKFHESASDPAPLIVRIDQQFRNGGEEIAVGENADAADELSSIPSAEVDGVCQRAGGRLARVGARPNALSEREKVVDREVFPVSQVRHVRDLVAM